ncbi:MAG: FAD-binding protein [Proteobacteria bacterium]|nr:FAD-binding protein [Pseudomonadota bacterium]MBT4987484.1 FAD-binding protein [Pseudomonadota bacterium]MBT5190266.1 FAD-binding protein [Pseudomonadota bacterium]MBT5624005.1 FAD-binding protein [Pseudomonadota bacterium]MBT6070453.1 FAD-binding protein [Pseudomonadota bacterium]
MEAQREKIGDQVAIDAVIEILQASFGDRLSQAQAVRERFGKDESFHGSAPPDAVVTPYTTEEVSQIVKTCSDYQVPVIPYGTGTALEGHVAALHGGISINMQEMNQILEVHDEDLDVVVQPGVTRKQLNRHLHDRGLFFPIDPGADASIGGMAACRASGTNAVRYGTMRENVLALTVVLADGRVIKTSSRARKSAAGYDLTRLFVGSEGTLGVITEVTLRLYGIPEAIASAVCTFTDLDSAVSTVITTIQYGVPVARIELIDEVQIDAINKYSKTDLAIAPTLFLEFHGTDMGVQEQSKIVQGIAAESGGSNFEWTTNTEERNRLWQARHDAAYACKALVPNGEIWATDVCVPISQLAECIRETQVDIRESKLIAPIVGHVGDGNFHLVLLVDKGNAEEVQRAHALHERMVMRALAMGGTCTGEHGIGYGKLDFLIAEHGEAVNVMRSIKQALDPNNIMNPGKVLRV